MKLLSKGTTNTKTVKNNLPTFILYLAPHTQNSKGFNVCSHASDGCVISCLFSAGRGKFNNVKNARINKTEFLLSDKKAFINQLAKEILSKVVYYKRKNQKIAFRLNGTSDLDFVYMLNKYADLDISTLSDTAVFYDYTKNLNKAIRYKDHKNYTVTFSRSESNQTETLEAIEQGINVAAVFTELPETYKGVKVIDGDKSDLEMVYNSGVILGLIAKGDAKKDTSGFVIKTEEVTDEMYNDMVSEEIQYQLENDYIKQFDI